MLLGHTPSTASRRIIFLTGAPQSEQLDWHEDQLHKQFDLTFGRTSVGVPPKTCATTSPSAISKWRTLGRQPSPQGPEDEQTEFLPSGTLDYQTSLRRLEEVFPDRSLAFLEDAAVSGTVDSNEAPTQSFYSALTESDQSVDVASSLTRIPPNITITRLKDIPNARRLPSITPRERTVNLLAGIIAVQPLRTVRTRRHNAHMDIVEIVIGDGTRAGFSITTWLVPGDDQAGSLRPRVLALRPNDLVLITNIALSSFNGCVYGQSTSRRTTRDGTRIFKVQNHRHELSHLNQEIESLMAWAEHFLRHGTPTSRRKDPDKEILPPETPDG
ncbi:hypothetical protein AMS68_004740 [Peltaster fructicola]|uniref:OB domain-containing protein n=1 Tax=Peltaster fructicola TaxID=286661 RepID=A0A6H0XWU6_9PEZI|nr:hypothetical protein AMS68_004740 [Peltaster fructicola]